MKDNHTKNNSTLYRLKISFMDKYEDKFIIMERVNALWSTLCESCDLIDQSDALYFKRFLELQMFC